MIQNNYYQNKSPFGGIIALVGFVLFFVVLYFLAKSVFTILSWLSIPLILIAAFLDHKVILNYVKYVFELIKKKPLSGILLSAFTVIGFPLVAAFLAFRAFIGNKLGSIQKQFEEEKETFTEFEEIEEEVLDLPEIEPEAQETSTNDYDTLFED